MRCLFVLFAAALVGTAQAQPDNHYQGAWQGPFLFYVVHSDSGARGKPAVHAGAIQIDADGAVHGQVPGAACRMTGSSTDYVSAANASIDLTVSGCADARFNGHFSGKLINNPVLKYASLRLSSMRSLDEGTAQVSAVMRR
ncbi:MAG: hypothetical protein WKG52_10105 [Variovorax sp.]